MNKHAALTFERFKELSKSEEETNSKVAELSARV